MASLICGLPGSVLRSNSLELVVLAGCLQISREGIFTGLYDLKTASVTDTYCDQYFGFTEREVRDLLDIMIWGALILL